MKVKVKIEGFINVEGYVTEQEVEDAIYFSLGMGALPIDNPIESPDWDSAEVDVFI